MKKTLLIFFSILFLGTLACGGTAPSATEAPQTDPTPVPVIDASPTPPPLDSPTEVVVEPTLSPSGLRVLYIRMGNLWSWTDASGSVQLTDTGDMSTVCILPDGQLLAFMRGPEVWTVRMDGTDARLLMTQNLDGAALWFAPNGSSLGISTQDHIDVVDLNTSNSSTVVTYPALPHGYYPEIVWTPDSSGFKTVIPAPMDSGQAELLFVFTNGTIASLAKFAMVPLSESWPHISPDGGYIIYVARINESSEALHLMDSSGATKPYGQAGEKIRVLGWLPDSMHFAYSDLGLGKVYLGNIGGQSTEVAVAPAPIFRWVDAEHYLALENGELVLSDISGGNMQIDSNVRDFDFVP
jgi:hypothetical protein